MVQTTARELGTILAALRFWQEHGMPETVTISGHPLWDIATDMGTVRALSSREVDALAEKLNCVTKD